MTPLASAKDLVLWPVHACLLSELVETVCKSHTLGSLNSLAVVFPTKRLGLYFLAKLAERLTALKPPKIFTLENLILEETRLRGFNPVMISEVGQKILLSSLIKESSFKHIHIGHEHEIMQIFSEVSEMELGEEIFQRLLEYLNNDVYRGDEEIKTLCERADELKHLFSLFHSRLSDSGLIPLYKALSHGAQILSKEWDHGKLPWSHLYIVGFSSVTKAEQRFLKVLGGRDDVSIWINEPDQKQEASPLVELKTILSSGGLTVKNDVKDKNFEHKKVFIFKAPSVFAEVKAAFAIVKKLVDQGTPPTHIGILVTSEGIYGRLIHSLLKEHQEEYLIKANTAITFPLSQTLVGGWIKALSTIAIEGEEAEFLHSFLMHPFTISFIKKKIKKDFSQQQISYQISEALTKGSAAKKTPSKFKGFEDLSYNLHLAGEVDLGTAIDEVSLTIATVRMAGPAKEKNIRLKDWIIDFWAIYSKFVPIDGEHEDVINAAKEDFLSISHRLASDKGFTVHDFWSLIENHLLQEDVRTTGELFRGVQILTIREARYVPFETVIILGCTEGNFPKRLPSDDLIHYHIKTKLGLHPPSHLEALEDVTFSLLKARIPRLFLLYPTEELGEPTAPSRFIERIMFEEKVPLLETSLLETSFMGQSKDLSNRNELIPTQYEEGIFKGDVASLLCKLSATQIEKLIRCPYSFLLSKLGIKEASIQVADDVLREGSYLHGVLEAFYTGFFNTQKICIPLSELTLMHIDADKKTQKEDDFTTFCLERLIFITDTIFPDDLRETPLYNHLISHSWPRFAEHVTKLIDHPISEASLKTLGSGLKELNVDFEDLAISNHSLSVTGFVDSVDYFNQDAKPFQVITDYKRSLVPSARNVAIGLSPQLPFYALILSEHKDIKRGKNLSISDTLIGYWNIIEGAWYPRGAGKNAKEASIERGLFSSNARTKSLEEVIDNLKAVFSWRIDEILKAKFALDVSHCEMCPYAGICRKDDPFYKDYFKDKKAVKAFSSRGDDDE